MKSIEALDAELDRLKKEMEKIDIENRKLQQHKRVIGGQLGHKKDIDDSQSQIKKNISKKQRLIKQRNKVLIEKKKVLKKMKK